jgi:CRISPR/Cas system-associated endonuclease/helicase Cas3
VSTQCIEAGVDLDFELVYRALAPLDAIIQSAGRCNRNGRLKLGRFVVFIPEEERYPDEYYKNAANKVKLLAKQKVIDINNPQHIKEYYSYLYSEFNSDKPELIQAIARTDFAEVSKQYKLISNPVNNVIVPYKEEQELFDEVTCFIRENGLTAKMIEKARPISVSVYSNKIEDIAERVYFKSNKKGLDREKTNWFVLLDSMFYNEKTGLQINKISSLNTIC